MHELSLVARGLHSSCPELLTVAASLGEHRLHSAGLADTAHGLSCPVAHGILVSDQGSNPCPLLWQADS